MKTDDFFEQEIIDLIDSGIEGEYWDFKLKHYEKTDKDKTNMLHDILCMANTQSDHDGYIIFGVENKTCSVRGVENDPNRRCSENIISFLREISFVAGIRPEVRIKSFQFQNHEIDVLIVKNTKNTPYYLFSSFNDIRPFYIYTRVGDSNTPKNKSADLQHVEYLWKKRFGLTSSPLFRFKGMLYDKNNWITTESDYDVVYYLNAPEFTLRYSNNTNYDVNGNYFFANYWILHKPEIRALSLYYYGTELVKYSIVIVDDGKYSFPVPQASCIEFSDSKFPVRYYYYSKENIRYDILYYLEDNDYPDRQSLYNMIPIFSSDEERIAFEKFVKQNCYDYYCKKMNAWKDHFHISTSRFGWMKLDEGSAKMINDDLKWNKLLVNLLDDFRMRSFARKED